MAKKSRQSAQRDSEPSPSSNSASWSSVLATIFFALLALGYIYLGGEEPPNAASAASSSTSTSGEISPLSPLCGIGKVPGKGYGITAIKDIPLGTRILQERPLLTLPAHIHQKDVARHLVKMVDALPPLGQTVFYTLANTTQHKLGPSPPVAPISSITSIIRTPYSHPTQTANHPPRYSRQLRASITGADPMRYFSTEMI